MKTRLINKHDVAKLLRIDEVILAVEDAYKAFNSGMVDQPDYVSIHLEHPRGEIDFKAGHFKTDEVISMKASSGGFINNPKDFDLPTGMGTIQLYDARSCALICVLDGSLITGYRTGAAGAVSVKVLARKNAKIVTSIGTGKQGRNQIRAIREVMKIEEIYAWDEVPEAAITFKTDIEAEFSIPVVISPTKKDAVEHGDIVVTTTRGKGSLVEASWVKPGTHIVAIGTDQRGKQELDPEVFRGAKIVNDSISQCIQKGETWHPLDKGIIQKTKIYAEIGEILLGNKPGRENDQEITIFDSTGMAIQDNTTAYRIYQNAVKENLGSFFEFFE